MSKTLSHVDTQVLYPIADLCQRWHLSRPTVIKFIRGGQLEALRVGERFMCTLEQIEAFEDSLPTSKMFFSGITSRGDI